MARISYSLGTPTYGTGTLSYQQFSGGWALRECTFNGTISDTQLAQTAEFTNILWIDNPTGNSRRATKLTPASPSPVFPSTSEATPPLAFPLPPCTGTISVETLGQGPTNILYQHGILSDANTWQRMDNWIRSDFPFAAVAKSSLCSQNRLTDQADILLNLLQGTGRTNFLAVGHSQGGLIVRDAAFRSSNLMVDRVITLDTPNNGAWITQSERAALAGGIVNLAAYLITLGNASPIGAPAITLGTALIAGLPPLAVMAFDASVPATTDLRPGSSYLATLNSRYEVFRNTGIRSSSPARFVEWRVVGDAFCNPEQALCGGRALAGYANFSYTAFRVCWIIASLIGRYDIAMICGSLAGVLDYVDLFWYSYTSFGDSSDGIVQTSGQRYDGALFNRLITNADSHTGATKSDKVRTTLDQSLQQDFFLSPRSCMTGSVYPTNFSIPDIGGNGSFSVSTGSGCPWTAVSSVPWITINAGASGNGVGTVSFTAEVNLSPAARVGTIAVTGLTAGLTVTITQAGIPSDAAVGSVTINGSEQGTDAEVTYWTCLLWYSDGGCAEEGEVTELQWVWDTGQVWITVNGQTKSVWYDESSTADSIAMALAAAINNDSSFPVRAAVTGTTLRLISRSTQGANYTFSAGTIHDWNYFSEPSFTVTTSGPTLTGSP